MDTKDSARGQSWMSTFKAVLGNIIHVHGLLDFGNLFVKQLLDKCSNVFWKDVHVYESSLIVLIEPAI